MKFIFVLLCMVPVISIAQESIKDTTLMQPVEVIAIRAADRSPVAKTNVGKAEIDKKNIGQDLPFILNHTPSVVVNSDAGNGIGYTGIRIRGSDASRINVTLNGIPYNDAESQGTFFVDMPDVISSAGSIQVQRGVGTSTNGAGSFGGTINISTNDLVTKRSLELNNSAGSYNTFKHSLVLHSGLLAKHITIDARLSNIRSNGYIDRASSKLYSFHGSAAYSDNKNNLRLNVLTGKEKTYQAWNGVDETKLIQDRRYNSSGTEKPGDPYKDETDNYTQTHYQLFYNRKAGKFIKLSLAFFLTRGIGYYEQYKAGESFADYLLPDVVDDTVVHDKTDLVRRLWLDNYFYGSIFSLQYNREKTSVIFGGSWNKYDGKHYGTVNWTAIPVAIPHKHRWYDVNAVKSDYSVYAKWTQQLQTKWHSFVDIQVRSVNYEINGFRYNPGLQANNNYLFFNPKAGITYSSKKTSAHLYYGRASKEPNRDDFESGSETPKPETMNDFELGIENKFGTASLGMNLYYMQYHNQLVLTGRINDVGAYTRTNIPSSYRLGIEIDAANRFAKWLTLNGNITLSENKIRNFTEFIDDYDNGGQQTKFYEKTNISFSPAVTSSLSVDIIPVKNLSFSLVSKYVSRQYLDNTSQRNRSLDPYYTQDARAAYSFAMAKIKNLDAYIQVNNIFSKKYEPNGYTFSYIYGGSLTTENFYFPMATINFMMGLNIRL